MDPPNAANRTGAPDLTDPSELLSESKQPSLSLRVGEEEAGRCAGSQPLEQALRSARSPRVAPLSRTVVGKHGGSQRR